MFDQEGDAWLWLEHQELVVGIKSQAERKFVFAQDEHITASDKPSYFFLQQIYLSLRYLKLEHEEGALFTDVKLEGGHS